MAADADAVGPCKCEINYPEDRYASPTLAMKYPSDKTLMDGTLNDVGANS